MKSEAQLKYYTENKDRIIQFAITTRTSDYEKNKPLFQSALKTIQLKKLKTKEETLNPLKWNK